MTKSVLQTLTLMSARLTVILILCGCFMSSIITSKAVPQAMYALTINSTDTTVCPGAVQLTCVTDQESFSWYYDGEQFAYHVAPPQDSECSSIHLVNTFFSSEAVNVTIECNAEANTTVSTLILDLASVISKRVRNISCGNFEINIPTIDFNISNITGRPLTSEHNCSVSTSPPNDHMNPDSTSNYYFDVDRENSTITIQRLVQEDNDSSASELQGSHLITICLLVVVANISNFAKV